MQNENENIFSTSDIVLASTLVSLKFLLLGFDIQFEGEKNKPVAYFKFEGGGRLEEARRKFLGGMLSVEPKNFMLNFRSLKSEIENSRKNPAMSKNSL